LLGKKHFGKAWRFLSLFSSDCDINAAKVEFENMNFLVWRVSDQRKWLFNSAW